MIRRNMATGTKSYAKRSYKSVGTRPVRHDGIDKLVGTALYGADIKLSGMLHAKVLRSPYPHARILSIDTSKAEDHPSVRAIITSDDLPPQAAYSRGGGEMANRDPIIGSTKVLYKGHPVAAVAATSVHEAEEALSLIDVEYEPLPFASNLDDALTPDAPILHEDWIGDGLAADDESFRHHNVAAHEYHSGGNLDMGFAQADEIFDRKFRTKTVHQGYIEPQNAVASWSPDGQLTIWCSSQGHFGIRDNVAAILDIPSSRVKVVPMEIGGGFGGKLTPYLEPLAALLSKKTSNPVKMTMSREEVLEATGPTSSATVQVKIGVTKEGRLTAADAVYYFDGGAYSGAPLPGAAAAIFAPYTIENVRINGYEVVTNKPTTRAYRAPGAPIVGFAVESTMDEIANELGIDRMELRILNVARPGDRRADGVTNAAIGAEQVMDAVRSHPHYSKPLGGSNRGRGVGMGFCRNNSGPASVIANVQDDGRVSLVEGSVDIGGSRTVVAQQLAEVLGISVEDVTPSIGDTDTIGYTSNTGGSGAAFKSGWAAHEAAHDIISQLIDRCALIWDVPPDEIEYHDGAVRHKSDTELSIDFSELASRLSDTGGPVVGRANLNPAGQSGSYSANIIDVEIDPETGKVEVLACTAFQDVGNAIHPSYVEGQMQGGTAQGVGWALNEEYFIGEDGALQNTSLLDYRMPTTLDLPMIEAVMVEVFNPGHPFGVRGVGEANISAPLGAMANAIHSAIGVRICELPMNPQAVLRAIHDQSVEGKYES